MDLTSIIFKNIRYNIKNYIAYLFGNSFVICILFMFLNLVDSKKFINASSILNSDIEENLRNIAVVMVAFSILLILYTAISFTKFRGKEFGVYFTIGLTSKNIIKILLCENIIISASVFIFGAIFGSLFFRLFSMSVIKILNIKNINIDISLTTYVYIAVIAAIIFIFNTIYQTVFLKKTSIVQILKANSKRANLGIINSIFGVAGIIIIIMSMIYFKNSVNQVVIHDSQNIAEVISICAGATIISIYFVIGFIMILIAKIARIFKGFYNSNILVLNSLVNRFTAYRGALFVVTLLVAGAMLFIPVVYAMYRLMDNHINNIYPYDLSFIVGSNQKNEDFKNIIKAAGAEIKDFNMIEGIEVPYLIKVGNSVKWVTYQVTIVSNDNYNMVTNKNVNLEQGHAILLYNDKNTLYNSAIIDFPSHEFEMNKLSTIFRKNLIPFDQYKKAKNNKGFLYLQEGNIINQKGNIFNYLNSGSTQGSMHLRIASIVVSNEDYKIIRKSSVTNAVNYDVSVNIKNGDNYQSIMDNLKSNFSKIKDGENIKDTIILKQNKSNIDVNTIGFELFICSSLGIMLLIGSIIILYFKVFTSFEEDKKRAYNLVKLGLMNREINCILVKELAVVFIVPPVIAITLVVYYLFVIFSYVPEGKFIFNNCIKVFGIYGLIHLVFYIFTVNKYVRDIKG